MSTMKNLPLPAKAIVQLLLGPVSQERFVKMNMPVKDVIFGWKLNSIYDIVVTVATQMNMTFPPELQHGEFGFYLDVSCRFILCSLRINNCFRFNRKTTHLLMDYGKFTLEQKIHHSLV